MTEEDRLIAAILKSPSESAPRLAYADWLEARGGADDQSRADYLRTECELDSLPKGDRKADPRRRRLNDRLRALRDAVGDDWWRTLDSAKVEYCVEFEFQCPQRWDTLTPTDKPNVRHCGQCDRTVTYCRNGWQARDLARRGQCVAIDSRHVRIPLPLLLRPRPQGMPLGRVTLSKPPRVPLSQRGRPVRK